jgi:hypothetical protein
VLGDSSPLLPLLLVLLELRGKDPLRRCKEPLKPPTPLLLPGSFRAEGGATLKLPRRCGDASAARLPRLGLFGGGGGGNARLTRFGGGNRCEAATVAAVRT